MAGAVAGVDVGVMSARGKGRVISLDGATVFGGWEGDGEAVDGGRWVRIRRC